MSVDDQATLVALTVMAVFCGCAVLRAREEVAIIAALVMAMSCAGIVAVAIP